MITVVIAEKFLKELAKIPTKERIKIEKFVFEEIKNISAFNELHHLEKLKGDHSSYKIRFGNYRVGVKIENKTITFMRVLHRKEIYKYFP
jgi:mRNA interferase RelE/StbE